MPRIVYIQYDGTERAVDAVIGQTVMQTAVDQMIPGIVGDCGGVRTCATCHSYVDPAWLAKTGDPSAEERAMLEGAIDVRSNSRLACQIVVTADLDGLVVHLPESQF